MSTVFARELLRQLEQLAPLGEAAPLLARAAEALAEGHVCVPLAEPLPACPHVGVPGEFKPFIVDGDRLYLARYREFEARLAGQLRQLAAPAPAVDLARLQQVLAHWFPRREAEPDWQQVAAAQAVLRRLTVISGGPGTGKTTTVLKLLATLVQLSTTPPLIRLAAPTGKAAQRMSEALREQKARLALPESVAAAIPETAETLHRLLGSRPFSPDFRHNRDNPLPLDILIVDEASMIDLALMSRLFDALPPQARLVLLGDRDQLASVEAGAVFGDLCAMQAYSPTLAQQLAEVTGVSPPVAENAAVRDLVATLRRSYRFAADSGIGALARAVNAQDAALARAVLSSGQYADLHWVPLAGTSRAARLLDALMQGYQAYWQAVADTEPAAVFAALAGFRGLASVRQGPVGAQRLNQQLEERFRRLAGVPPATVWYRGRVVMVTENDYAAGLFNGDIGVVLDGDNGLSVVFPQEGGGWRWFSPGRLPAVEPAFVMTVHKSQGSEFARVLFVLPEEPSPVATRNLIYTAITRARQAVSLWAPEPALLAAIDRAPARYSGLAWRLAQPA